MKYFKDVLLGILLIAGSAEAAGIDFNIGPFDLHFNVDTDFIEHHPIEIYQPICNAIRNQHQLSLIVTGKEVGSEKEMKIVTKKLIVEPYVFGVTRDGKPLLRGKVIEEGLIKEVSIKYGEEQFPMPEKQSWVPGWFKSADQTIDIQSISEVRVLLDTHFDLPKQKEAFINEEIRIICQIPATST